MITLLEQTKEVLAENNKTLEDIVWVGCETFTIPIKDFLELANVKVNYDDFGEENIVNDLLVCGDDWWLERAIYDGSEWWEFKTIPSKPNTVNRNVNSLLIGSGSYNLSSMNSEQEL